jgi:hypothetical protein
MAGKPWTTKEIAELRRLVAGNTPTGVIALKLERSKRAIRLKSHQEGISLKPVKQGSDNLPSRPQLT